MSRDLADESRTKAVVLDRERVRQADFATWKSVADGMVTVIVSIVGHEIPDASDSQSRSTCRSNRSHAPDAVAKSTL